MQENVTESSYVQKISLPFLLNFLDDAGAHGEREASRDSAFFYQGLTSIGFYQGNIHISFFSIFHMISTNTEMFLKVCFRKRSKGVPEGFDMFFVAHCNGVTV